MKFLKILAQCTLLAFLANCSLDVSIDEFQGDDFLKSTILATSRGIGDGQTSATVVVLLKNSDDTTIANYKPEFDFIDNNGTTVAGSGITFSDCTESGSDGVATCTFRSVQVGSRMIMFNNIPIELIGELYFDAPLQNGPFLQYISASQTGEEVNGYVVTSQVGSPFTGLRQEVNGWTIFTNTTGGILPSD